MNARINWVSLPEAAEILKRTDLKKEELAEQLRQIDVDVSKVPEALENRTNY